MNGIYHNIFLLKNLLWVLLKCIEIEMNGEEWEEDAENISSGGYAEGFYRRRFGDGRGRGYRGAGDRENEVVCESGYLCDEGYAWQGLLEDGGGEEASSGTLHPGDRRVDAAPGGGSAGGGVPCGG